MVVLIGCWDAYIVYMCPQDTEGRERGHAGVKEGKGTCAYLGDIKDIEGRERGDE